jgi:hypothetical protein
MAKVSKLEKLTSAWGITHFIDPAKISAVITMKVPIENSGSTKNPFPPSYELQSKTCVYGIGSMGYIAIDDAPELLLSKLALADKFARFNCFDTELFIKAASVTFLRPSDLDDNSPKDVREVIKTFIYSSHKPASGAALDGKRRCAGGCR